MATNEINSVKLLLEQEETVLARKKEAVKAAGTSLEALRRAITASTEALGTLRELGFSQRDVTTAFGLTREETALLTPRRTRRASAAGDDSDAALDGAAGDGAASASTTSSSSAA
jgi:CRP-like cAMP-binding protein